MKKITLLLTVGFISALIISCTNNKTSKESADSIDDVTVEDIEMAVSDMPMPASYEIIQLLNASGAGYIFDVTNPASSVEKYITYKQKAINLGIYAADLTYTTTYQKKDETAMYLDNFVQLVEDLEITTLDSKFFESVQRNLDNKDSLVVIIKNAQEDTHKFLNSSGKSEVALYALTGSWIEGMYLVGATVKFADNKEPLYNVIAKHKKSLADLIKLMDSKKGDEGFADLYEGLSEIHELFKDINADDINLKAVEELKDKIIEFRNSLV